MTNYVYTFQYLKSRLFTMAPDTQSKHFHLLRGKMVYFDTMLFYVRKLILVIYSYLILEDQVHSSWLLVGIS